MFVTQPTRRKVYLNQVDRKYRRGLGGDESGGTGEGQSTDTSQGGAGGGAGYDAFAAEDMAQGIAASATAAAMDAANAADMAAAWTQEDYDLGKTMAAQIAAVDYAEAQAGEKVGQKSLVEKLGAFVIDSVLGLFGMVPGVGLAIGIGAKATSTATGKTLGEWGVKGISGLFGGIFGSKSTTSKSVSASTPSESVAKTETKEQSYGSYGKGVDFGFSWGKETREVSSLESRSISSMSTSVGNPKGIGIGPGTKAFLLKFPVGTVKGKGIVGPSALQAGMSPLMMVLIAGAGAAMLMDKSKGKSKGKGKGKIRRRR